MQVMGRQAWHIRPEIWQMRMAQMREASTIRLLPAISYSQLLLPLLLKIIFILLEVSISIVASSLGGHTTVERKTSQEGGAREASFNSSNVHMRSGR